MNQEILGQDMFNLLYILLPIVVDAREGNEKLICDCNTRFLQPYLNRICSVGCTSVSLSFKEFEGDKNPSLVDEPLKNTSAFLFLNETKFSLI